MGLESVICRRKLDEAKGNDWICACPLCQEARRKDPSLPYETGGDGSIDAGQEAPTEEKDTGP